MESMNNKAYMYAIREVSREIQKWEEKMLDILTFEEGETQVKKCEVIQKRLNILSADFKEISKAYIETLKHNAE